MIDFIGASLLIIVPMFWGWLGINAIKKIINKKNKNKIYYFYLVLALIFFLSLFRMIELTIQEDLQMAGIKWNYGKSLLDIFGFFDLFLISPTLLANKLLALLPLEWFNTPFIISYHVLCIIILLVWGWLGIESIKYVIKHKPGQQNRYWSALLLAISFMAWIIFWIWHPLPPN